MVVKIETYFDGKYWCAKGVGVDIFTQARSMDQLIKNIDEAVSLHFEDEIKRGAKPEVLILSEIKLKDAKITTH